MEYDPNDERELAFTAGARCAACTHEFDPATSLSITGEFSCPGCGLSFPDIDGSIVVSFDGGLDRSARSRGERRRHRDDPGERAW